MSLTTDLVILLTVFFIAKYNTVKSEGTTLNSLDDDEENSLKQAIFLVELLKSDFGKVLRENSLANANNETDDNSTCPTPEFENTTESAHINLANILPGITVKTEKDVPTGSPATTPGVRIEPGAPGYVAPEYAAPGYTANGYAAPGYGGPGYAAPAYGVPGYGGPGYGVPGYGPPGYAAPGYVAPGYSATGSNAPGSNTPRSEAQGSYAPGFEAPRSDGPGSYAPGSFTPGSYAPGSEAPGPSTPAPNSPPFSNWAPMPMPGYQLPPAYSQRRNFPADENYRFPYRFSRRRIMPDYYYFDAPPFKPQGNYRRQGSNDPPANETATPQPPTSSIPSTTSEVTSSPTEESTTTTPTSLTTVSPSSTLTSTQVSPSPSTLTSAPESSLQTTETPLQAQSFETTQTTQVSPLQSTPTLSLDSSVQSILLTEPVTEQTPSTNQSEVDSTTPALISKASSAIIAKRKKKHKLKRATGYHHLRQRTTSTTSEKYASEDVEVSQAAAELMKEFKGSPTENMALLQTEFEKLTSRKKTSTTMKIYLKGSSRLPVPLPENNAFCHAYPRNVLCGNVM